MPATALDARLLQMTITAYMAADRPPHTRPHGESATPWPCATTTIGGKTVKVLSARLSEQKGSTPGAVIESKGKLVVACGDGGGLELLTVQPQGKKAMDAKAFLAGHPVAVGTVLGA